MKEIKIKNSDEIIYSFTAPSGLPVYMWLNEKKENAFLSLCVRYGSINTSFKCGNIMYTVPSGVAHFLEHMKFHLKDADASELFFDLGCDSNAYTAHQETVYEVYANNNIYEATKLLLDFVYDDYFSKKDVENERAIILEETNSKKDIPAYEFYQKYLNNFYEESNYKKPIIGTEEDIKKITIDDIKLVYDYFYRPENMFMVITGKFDPSEMEKVVCKNEENRKFTRIGKIKLIDKNEPEKLLVKSYEHKSKNCENPLSKVSIKTNLSKFKKRKGEVVTIAVKSMLLAEFGPSSDFYEYIMQNNLVTSFYTSVSLEDKTLGIDFNFQTDNEKQVYNLIMKKLKSIDINEDDLKRIKNSTKAQFIVKFDNIYNVASSMIISLIENNRPDSMAVSILESLSAKDINEIFNCVNINNNMIGSLKQINSKKKEVK